MLDFDDFIFVKGDSCLLCLGAPLNLQEKPKSFFFDYIAIREEKERTLKIKGHHAKNLNPKSNNNVAALDFC